MIVKAFDPAPERTALMRLAIRVTAGFFLGAMTVTAATAGVPDLTGTWKPAAGQEEIRTLDGKPPPLLPAALDVYRRHLQLLKSGDRKLDPVSRCIPPGVPRIMYENRPFEIVQRPDLVVLLFEYQRLVRHIYVGGSHPPDVAVPPYLGHSIGHWDGNTLVVDTVDLNDETFLDAAGMPHSDALHIVERLRLLDGGRHLEDVFTVDDPKTFVRSWQARRIYDRKPGMSIREDACLDREHRATSLEDE